MNGHSLYHHYRVPAATRSTIPVFRLPCKSVFRDSHHNVSFLNSSNTTERQPGFPSSKKPKHYTIESLSKPLPTRRNTEEALRFFLLAAATHTTIQTPQHPCNPKKGEVGHKKGPERVSNTLLDTKHPSQSVLRVTENLQKTSKKPHKRRRNHSNPRRKPSESPLEPSQQPLFLPPAHHYLTDRCRKPLLFHPEGNRRRGAHRALKHSTELVSTGEEPHSPYC